MKSLTRAKISNRFANEDGIAMIETLPLVIIFVFIFSFAIGFFGVVHTGILNSIGARTYAFETFSWRSDTILFRDRSSGSDYTHYKNFGSRFHTINDENYPRSGQFATTRPIAIGRQLAQSPATELDHNTNIYNISGRNRKGEGVEASPAWVMVGYGLCLNVGCGD